MNPRLAHSLDAWPLYDSGSSDSRWAVGSDYADRYLTVPASSLDSVRTALQLMDGSRTVQQISSSVRFELGRDIDVERLVRLAETAGLLTRSRDGAGHAQSELGPLSTVLLRLSLRPVSERLARQGGTLPAFWLGAQIVIACLAVAIIGYLPASTQTEISWSGALVVACGLSLLAHEVSHYLVAFDKGIRASSLCLVIYAGIIPVVYVRLPGIFRLAPSDRIRVWISGCACNGAIAIASNALARVADSTGHSSIFWLGLERWNLMLIIVSLIPFLPTDGYFILSTALRTYNLRSRAYLAMGDMLRGRMSGFDWKAIAFLLVAFPAITMGILYSASAWGRWAEQNNIPRLLGWVLPLLLLLYRWMYNTLPKLCWRGLDRNQPFRRNQ